jgi:prolipoprotein diacylglyceryltransferase
MVAISLLVFQLKFVFSDSLIVGSQNGGFYFDLFYILAFLLATIWMLLEGNRNKFHWVSWLLVLAISRLFFIIGTKVISYSTVDWIYFFQKFEFLPANDKVILGGFIFGLVAFWSAVKLFRLPISSFDALAIALPLSIFVQRIGCFILGCCFGTPSTVPWGVRYSFGTLPHMHQFQQGLIQANTSATYAIHPFQLYEALNGLVVVILVLVFRKKIKTPGSTFLFSIGTWALIRSLIEFFRDPFAHAMGGEIIFGMKVIQWMLLLTGIVSITIFYWRNKYVLKVSKENFAAIPSVGSVWIVLMLTVFVTWSLRNWLSAPEMVAMNLMLYPAIILSTIYLFKEHTVASFRWMTLAGMVLPLILMSQTLVKEKEDEPIEEEEVYSFFNLGYSSGEFFSRAYYQVPGSNTGCGPNTISEEFRNNYWNMGIGYGKVKSQGEGIFTYGFNGSFGQYSEINMASNLANERVLFAFNPYVKYDTKLVGFGAGLYLGNNYWADVFDDESLTSNLSTSAKRSPVFPQAYLRFGPERKFFGDIGIANAFPSPFPGMRFEAAIGSGFGLPLGNKFRIGRSTLGTFFQGQVLFSERFLGSATYQWGKENFYSGGQTSNKQIFLGLQYRIPQ